MMTVRCATAGDQEAVAEVCALATATLRETYRPREGAVAGRSRPRELTRLVAELDGRILGTVQYYIDGDRLHLIGLGVHPDFRRHGVARRIMDYVEDMARSACVRRLSLNTVKETGNVAVFEGLGFEAVSEEQDKWAESDKHERLTDVYMEKTVIR